MPLVSKTLPGLFNGVSQQPDTLRLDSQCELQENALSLIVDGVSKRPPTEWVANISSKANPRAFVHTINRDINERYVVVITADPQEPIEIFTLDGTKCTVLYDPGTIDYICKDNEGNLLTNPRDSLRAVTVADHTILVNKTKVAAMKDETTPVPQPWALFWVKRNVSGCLYQIEVFDASGTQSLGSASVTTKNSPDDNTSGRIDPKTDEIAKKLHDDLKSKLGTSNWEFKLLGSSFLIRRKDGGDFVITTKDSYGNTALAGVKGKVQSFTDLPVEAENGLVVEVSGNFDNAFDNYYVQYQGNTKGSGVWVETVKPGLKNKLDPATLPHRLVRTGYNEFTLKQIEWSDRLVGDEASAPEPSFIGRTINDVFFFKNRLGFLSSENVILSRAGDYFNFFPGTATDVLDGDPIDISVATTSVAVLRHAVPFTNALLLFSDQQQFTLSASGGLLTPNTVAVTPSTAFETSANCKPVGAGPNVYFVVPNGEHSSVREYYVQSEQAANDAADVTAHVPRYLPRNITHMAVSSAKDILFLVSPDEPNSIYVYKYYWDGEQKVQSAWSKWIFGDEIIDIAVLENYLYLVQRCGSQVWLGRMNLEKIPTGGLPFRVHLDKQVTLVGTYDPDTNETTWVLPYSDPSLAFTVVEGARGNQILGAYKPADNIIKARGDYSDRPCHIGKNYTMRFRFSKFYLRDTNGVALTQGRLQIRTLTLTFTDTGYFRLEGTSQRPATVRHEMNGGYYYEQELPVEGRSFKAVHTGVMLGVSTIGSPSIISGERRFPVMSNAVTAQIDLVNDSYLPSHIQTAAFEGLWTSRSQVLR